MWSLDITDTWNSNFYVGWIYDYQVFHNTILMSQVFTLLLTLMHALLIYVYNNKSKMMIMKIKIWMATMDGTIHLGSQSKKKDRQYLFWPKGVPLNL